MDNYVKQSDFYKSASDRKSLVVDDFKQIVFAGKSNVGKSSLINSLLRRKKLAKTSQTPGKTKLINYFTVNNEFYFVDLPGFGYAKVSKKEREYWKKMISTYLEDNEKLVCAISIIDIRHDPQEHERNMITMFSHFEIPQIVILSKSDKLAFSKINQRKAVFKKIFKDETIVDIIPYSSVKHTNRGKVLEIIDSFIKDENENIEDENNDRD